MLRIYHVCLLILTFTIPFIFAQVPQQVNYQGFLSDQNGNPLNEQHNIVFKIYNSQTGGSAIWSETHTVNIENGLYSVLLGSQDTLSETTFNGTAKFLGIKVDADPEMTPRQKIVSVGYAIKAKVANPIGSAGGDLFGTYPNPSVSKIRGRTISTTAPGSGQVLKWNGSSWAPGTDNSGGPPTGNAGGDLSGTFPNPSVSKIRGRTVSTTAPGSGQVLKWNGSSWAPGTDNSGGPPTGNAGGDLSGTFPNPSVSKIRGRTVSTTAPGSGQVLKWNGSSWAPGTDNSGGPPTGNAGGDLSGTFPNPSVSKIRGRTVSTTAPGSGQVLKWNGSSWAPGTDNSGGPPTGNAGGDLSGTFPNPSVSKIRGRTVSTTAPSSGQVLEWNGSQWSPGLDNNTTYSAGAGLTLSGTLFSHNPHTGDVSGTTSLTVTRIRNRSIANETPVAGEVLKWVNNAWRPSPDGGSDNDWTISDSNIYRTTGNVGIGTSSPAEKLHINGNLKVNRNNNIKLGTGSNIFEDNAGELIIDSDNNVRVSGFPGVEISSSDGAEIVIDEGNIGIGTAFPSTDVHIVGQTYIDGNVGIGTSTPNSKLHVSGTTTLDGDLKVLNNQGSFRSLSVEEDVNIYGQLSAATDGIGQVLIGSSPVLGNSQLSVKAGEYAYAGNFTANNLTNNSTVLNAEFNGTGTKDIIAVRGISKPIDFWGIGGEFIGGYKGIRSEVIPTGNNAYKGVDAFVSGGSGTNYGVDAYASGAGTNYGVYGSASGGVTNYAVYASGNLAYTGSLINLSDQKFKENIRPIQNALSTVMELKPKSFDYKNNEYEQMNLATGKQYGFIAQELERIIPELVVDAVHPSAEELSDEKTERKGSPINYKGTNYISMIPIIVKAMQEQQQIIEKQTAEIANLKQRLTNLEAKQ